MKSSESRAFDFGPLEKAAYCNLSLLSPLRYPGGKRRLLPNIARAILALQEPPSLLVEPFAGGASIAVGLMEYGVVSKIAIADADPMVAAFWKCVFDPVRAKDLADRTLNAQLSVDRWLEMREWRPRSQIDLAWRCLYLNRTSFSGILHERAGPIGGYHQNGSYTIGVRFPLARLSKRILELSKHSEKVAWVKRQDWRETLRRPYSGPSARNGLQKIFWYIDPPFWAKADRLYRYAFDDREHHVLAKRVKALPGPWIVSYDHADEVERLYAGAKGVYVVSLRYTARGAADSTRSRELLFSNIPAARGRAGKSLAIFSGGRDATNWVDVRAKKLETASSPMRAAAK